jgi:hypothetical protein
MTPQKLLHRLPSMPPRTIYIQPNAIALQMPVEMTQHLQEALPVSAGGSDHTPTFEQGCHPARHIEAVMVLAGRGNPHPLSAQAPAPSGAGMQGEAALVLKSHRLMPAQAKEFFLTGRSH